MPTMKDIFPECPICSSKEGYEYSGFRTKFVKCKECETKWKLRQKSGQIQDLMIHELPKNGSAIFTIKGTKYDSKPLYEIIGENLDFQLWKKLKVDKTINWDYYSNLVNTNAVRSIILDKEEKFLHQWKGQIKKDETIISLGTSQKVSPVQNGILLLSTRKIYWIAEIESGGFFKSKFQYKLKNAISLEKIRGISGQTGDSESWSAKNAQKEFCIVDDMGEHKFLLENAFIETLKPIIQSAIEIRKKEIRTNKNKQRVHFLLDFTFLRKYMENGGLTMHVLKCPQCQGKLDFPESGSQIKCSYCGVNILAQDIFEKVKNLLE